MKFNVNHPIIFIMVGIIIAMVLAQSIYFLVKALKRAREIGISGSVLKKTVSSSAIFSLKNFLITDLYWLDLLVTVMVSYFVDEEYWSL